MFKIFMVVVLVVIVLGGIMLGLEHEGQVNSNEERYYSYTKIPARGEHLMCVPILVITLIAVGNICIRAADNLDRLL